YDVTLNLLENGMSIVEIAKERGLAVGTIEGHLGRAVAQKRISIFKFVSEADVSTISEAVREMPEGFSSKELFDRLGSKFGYGVLRAVMNHVGILSEKSK
ncbi:MAG: helix-turn-helix domain-containing protein, partial [Flammeovirgaceae bacterium]